MSDDKVENEVVVQDVKEQEQKLEDTTEDRLETVFEKGESLDLSAEPSKDSEISTPEKDKPAEEDDDKDGPTPAEKEAEAKLEAEEKKDDEAVKAKDEDADKGGDKKDTPQLSDAYYRAAIHRGWTEEDIKEQFEANPELTIRTLGKVYEEVNRSSNEFAAIGRIRKEQILKEQVQPADVQKTEPEFKGADIEKLRKDYPDDPIVDYVKEMQAQNELLFNEVQTLKDSRSAQVIDQPSGVYDPHTEDINRRTALIEQQIEMYFDSDELKGYEEFYGKFDSKTDGWNSLMPAEKQNRWAVIEMMDQMITGASALGKELKIDEALRLAHLNVTEPIREKVIRDDIISKISKRDRSLSLKPSSSAKPESTKPQTQQELEDVTKERLSKIKGW